MVTMSFYQLYNHCKSRHRKWSSKGQRDRPKENQRANGSERLMVVRFWDQLRAGSGLVVRHYSGLTNNTFFYIRVIVYVIEYRTWCMTDKKNRKFKLVVAFGETKLESCATRVYPCIGHARYDCSSAVDYFINGRSKSNDITRV